MKLASQCSVCSHEDRDEIDAQLVGSVPLRALAKRFGLSKDAVHRHKTNHLDSKLGVVVAERIEAARIENLADQLAETRDAVQMILASAMADGKGALALPAVAQLRATIESLDRMLEREHARREVVERKKAGTGSSEWPGLTAAEAETFSDLMAKIDMAEVDTRIRQLEGELQAPSAPEVEPDDGPGLRVVSRSSGGCRE